jgi:hypothetical protein
MKFFKICFFLLSIDKKVFQPKLKSILAQNFLRIMLEIKGSFVTGKFWRHDTQHNDIQHNDTQYNGLFATISMNNTQHNSFESCYAGCQYAKCRAFYGYSECHYAECHYAECRVAKIFNAKI